MLQIEALRAGQVVIDPVAETRERSFYKLESTCPGGWDARHVSSGVVVTDDSVRRSSFTAVPRRPTAEIDLDPLLGRRVKLDLKFGGFSGVLREVRSTTLEVLGESLTIPTAVMVDGDVVAIAEIKSITLLD
jgi:hypothetical protein